MRSCSGHFKIWSPLGEAFVMQKTYEADDEDEEDDDDDYNDVMMMMSRKATSNRNDSCMCVLSSVSFCASVFMCACACRSYARALLSYWAFNRLTQALSAQVKVECCLRFPTLTKQQHRDKNRANINRKKSGVISPRAPFLHSRPW